ncbi:UDP-N-acetylmuramate:L-alanyl-gamma-D-glutamyl-meso-diaminopimelate ligase [Candidatus Persebacteraceae bacterium Df01]|jgi:UDP-N-acetylmuramate: L-alanyl-gamma-D-glutamyl-meso-diaminopimelate ligase|uniref:UDP-N-acetylmuramate:L-alanyl-gamma-D-glutamyl-meso-diaminopimelate ligase n=1 Tax=Candidatus Doriopsillibacter californiensis TaxID=2970740 RepID=A0ABT7QPH3_9GAMM|nr:UDP-N-acetylmuramate:L-alanyl-gamma-D-glutamyl-meso-diaminopimelate ligase [Candidatus Persebacteraceae bacterium Df01]
MSEHLHFIGIAGAFMAGAARIAKEMGYTVSGSDAAFYPPMGTQAQALGVPLFTGYDATVETRPADCYVVGNAVSRGNPLMESVLLERRPYISGAQWLGEKVLSSRTVLAVAGTHGKTTTTSLLLWLLERAGFAPGFLLGGLPQNFDISARLGTSPFFVIEADEYDTAFFDKRPKFLHYRPTVTVLNNLEFDHADIYSNVGEIVKQFHYLLRLLPADGLAIARTDDANLASAIKIGAYCPTVTFGETGDWQWRWHGKEMAIWHDGEECCRFVPPLAGAANRDNIVAAAAAAAFVGVKPLHVGDYLRDFKPPLRRLQKLTNVGDVVLYDDFGHHPTAYRKSLEALAEAEPHRRLLTVFEPRSNTMKAGIFAEELPKSLAAAEKIVAVGTQPWLEKALKILGDKATICTNADMALAHILQEIRPGDCILLMSNGDFGELPKKLMDALEKSRLHPDSGLDI